jgi:hypothetical protein
MELIKIFSYLVSGGLLGRDALIPAFLEEINLETFRASRRNLLRMDFDFKSCFGRNIQSIATLAGRSFGQHKALCSVHARFLAAGKHPVKGQTGHL